MSVCVYAYKHIHKYIYVLWTPFANVWKIVVSLSLSVHICWDRGNDLVNWCSGGPGCRAAFAQWIRDRCFCFTQCGPSAGKKKTVFNVFLVMHVFLMKNNVFVIEKLCRYS